jgi:hypothetical protein
MVLLAVLIAVHGQEKSQRPVQTQKSSRAVDMPYSVSNATDVDELQRIRELASRQAAKLLSARARKERQSNEPFADSHALQAIRVLDNLRANDDASINALVQNLALRSYVGGEPGDFAGFPSVDALINIGGKDVSKAILRRMQVEASEWELDACLYILTNLDDQEITVMRVERALRSAERRAALDGESDDIEVNNLRALIALARSRRTPE